MTEKDMYWLAGLLEGEGSFLKAAPSARSSTQIVISLQMTDRDIIEKVADLFGTSCVKGSAPLKSHWKQCYTTRVKGSKAAEIMRLLYPFMGERRKRQIEEALKNYVDFVPRLSYDDIVTISERYKTGEPQNSIAKDYGLDRTTVSYYARGKKLPKWFLEEKNKRDRGPDGRGT